MMSILHHRHCAYAVIASEAKDLTKDRGSSNPLSVTATSIVRSLAVCAARDDTPL